jgi:hypothetical protein
VHTINVIVFATAAVGGASAASCFAVAATIVAHGHDRVSMRDRIVVGLMMANAVYSTANAIPLNALRTDVVDCGRLAMSFDAIRFGRAWWFCGKYGLVGFELFVLGASICAMRRGFTTAVPRCAEATAHAACCALAALAFAVFYTLCAHINANGYNESTESVAYTNAFNHASANDDLDDDASSVAASSTFKSQRDAYDNLVRDMLVAWDCVVGVAVAMWIVLRVLHWHALRLLRSEAIAASLAEEADVWVDTRRSAWEARRRYLELRREAFTEVAKPLEPYIFVFVMFAAPAFVMSTPFCQSHSGATSAVGGSGSLIDAFTDFTYGTCDVWCEFALAFRSLGTVAVYLVPRKRRAELVAVRTTWRKLCTRVVGCVWCTPSSPYAPLAVIHGNEVEMDALGQLPTNSANNTNSAVVVDAAPAVADTSSWRICENDIIKEKQMGAGAFGAVWSGRLRSNGRRVAIKFLFAGVVDEDGDLVDPNAEEDFRKECAALQRVNSPHLLTFFGFGTTAEGNGFIVTELMTGGSLEDVLHDTEHDLPWRKRVSIGLQVALGMEHLHKLHMLHRDLKSANVLLDEELKAKVCDFGLSRIIKPARVQVVYSPFTGAVRSLPPVGDVESITDRQSALTMKSVGVSIMDARGGTMTKAAGTLQWMAPEVFRGDQDYTKAVDVYSFGIVLWELATGETPWKDTAGGDIETVLFEEINHALQTGRRPAIPDVVCAEHGAFVTVMQRCWAGDPANRPTFAEAARGLAAIILRA